MIYDLTGYEIDSAYGLDGNLLSEAYNLQGNNILDGTYNPYFEGDFYSFSAMSMTDENGIVANSTEHVKRSENTLKLAGTSSDETHTVTFECNIPFGDSPNVGIWMWIDRNAKGNYDTVTVPEESHVSITVGNTTKTYRGKSNDASLKSGMNYYLFTKNEVGTDTITSVSVSLKGAGKIYLDSVEVGFRMKVPHVLLNLDCSGRNFYPVGYPLFKQYGLTATFDYNISNDDISVGASSGSWTDVEDAQKHFEMVSDGFDYGSYSGWVENEGTRPPSMDDVSYYDAWCEHAQRMFALNNVYGIYAPSTVHCNAFKSGEVYQKAMVDAGFLCVRTDAKYLTSLSYMNEFVYFDGEDYREITPYYLGNCWDADDSQISNAKTLLSHCVRTGQNCMIMMHTIMANGYDHADDTLNVGYDAIEELLKTIKEYVDAGTLKCSTTAEFVREVCPEVYDTWVIERKKSASIV